jgi:hypothetical protein
VSQGRGEPDRAIDEDLKTAGLIFDFEPWRPQSKNHREIPNDSLGIETVIGKYPGNIRTALVYLEFAPDPSGSLASVP